MNRKKKPTREEMDNLYNKQDLSQTEVSEMYGVSRSTIGNWLRDYGFRIKTRSEAHLPARFKKPSKEELDGLYNKQDLSAIKIGEMYGVSNSTIGRWLDGYGFRIKTPSEAKLPKGVRKPSKEELDGLYNKQDLSAIKIGEMYGVSNSTIGRWLDGYGFRIKTRSEAHLPKGFRKLSRRELEELLKRLSIPMIAEKLGVNSRTVRRLIDSYNLDRKIRVKRGSWQSLEYAIEQAKKFLEENPEFDVLPSRDVLSGRGYSGLANAINRYHGGSPAFRNIMQGENSDKPSLLETYAGGEK